MCIRDRIKGFGEISSRSDTLGMPTRSRKSLEDHHRDPVDARVGEIGAKRKDNAVGTLRKEYGADVARGVRSGARLGDIREHREPKLRKRAKSTA